MIGHCINPLHCSLPLSFTFAPAPSLLFLSLLSTKIPGIDILLQTVSPHYFNYNYLLCVFWIFWPIRDNHRPGITFSTSPASLPWGHFGPFPVCCQVPPAARQAANNLMERY